MLLEIIVAVKVLRNIPRTMSITEMIYKSPGSAIENFPGIICQEKVGF